MKNSTEQLLAKAESLINKLEALLPPTAPAPDWSATAWRWLNLQGRGYLQAVKHPHHIALCDIKNVDDQKAEIVRNTKQFIQGLPANNVLLTGARGTGKSSIVKALLHDFSKQGLRLIEVEKQDLVALPEITALIRNRPERFIIFCDDLSFEAGDVGYKALKVALDGSVSTASENMLIYATSNRRHLMPEFMSDNIATQHDNGEIHPNDSIEEKNALSERFGLWLTFYAFDQDEYLNIAEQWLKHYGVKKMDDIARRAALQFSLTRGARSGRIAYQFARDYAGKTRLKA